MKDMKEKKPSSVTFFWLALLFAAVLYLLGVAMQAIPYTWSHNIRLVFSFRLVASELGWIYPILLLVAMGVSVFAGSMDAVLNGRVHVLVLKSFGPLIGWSLPFLVSFTVPAYPLFHWTELMFFSAMCCYSMFRKLIRNNKPYGQKLELFLGEIKSRGGIPTGDPFVHRLVWGTSLALVVLFAAQLGSLTLLVITHLRYFF